MKKRQRYDINSRTRFGFLEPIDVADLVSRCRQRWHNQTLCRVNDCVVRLGVLRGEFHWHKHDREDEFFFVLHGRLLVDLKHETVALKKHQGFTVPKGTVHRTRAPRRTAVLMVEAATVKPTGDRGRIRRRSESR